MSGEFVETLALLAVLEDDDVELERLIKDMLPGERKALAKAAEKLNDHCMSRCSDCDGYMPVNGPGGFVHSYPNGLFADEGVLHHEDCGAAR